MTNIGSINDLRKKVTQTQESISTSYHEAGHAIYGLLCSKYIESVYIFENKKTKRIDGFTHYESHEIKNINDSELLNNRLTVEVCLLYAGLAAEKHQFKLMSGSDKFPIFFRDGSSDDTLTASSIIRKHNLAPPGKKRYAYKKKLIKEIIKDLKDNWEAVTLVAHALFKRKKLSFLDLKTILTKKTKNRDFWKEKFKTIDQLYNNAGDLDEKTLKSILSNNL